MIKRTHLAIVLAPILLFLPQVNNKIIFVSVALIAALLPDIDSPDSYFGHHRIWRPLQFVVKHRGIFHSLTLCIAVSLLFSFVIPVLALPFFLGYSAHLFADCFTQEGITPFWPWKRTCSGSLRTGGTFENGLLAGFVIADIFLFIHLFL